MTTTVINKSGWSYRKDGFYHNEIHTKCQVPVYNKGIFDNRCRSAAQYAWTFWNGSVGFCCRHHLDDMEAMSELVLDRTPDGETIVIKPTYTGPFYLVVDGASEPSEHPMHWDLRGMGRCWCGAEFTANGWVGGKPLQI